MSNPNDPKQPTPDQPDPNAQPPKPDAPLGGYQHASSSFEFKLPDDVDSISELKIPGPDVDQSNTHAALPPKPVANRPVTGTFDFINISGSRSFSEIDLQGQGIDSGEPSVPTAVSLSDSKVGLGNLEPVVPVSGWMDSDVITGTPAPVAAAPSDPFDTPVADAPLTASVTDRVSAIPLTPSSSGSTPSLPTTPAYQHASSSFEFKLPDEVDSISELPPIPSPDTNNPSGTNFALPPQPEISQYTGTSLGDFGVELVALPPVPDEAPPTLVPTDDALVLPDLPVAGDSAILFEPLVPDLPAATRGTDTLTSPSLPDIGSLYPSAEPVSDAVLPEIPRAPLNAMADIDLGSESGILLSEDAPSSIPPRSSDIPLADTEPVTEIDMVTEVEAVVDAEPVVEVEPASAVLEAEPVAPITASVMDRVSAIPLTPSSSGSTPSLPTTPAYQHASSSFEFKLPDDVDSISELKIPGPDVDQSNTHAALPPKPVANRPVTGTFDFINISGSRSFSEIDLQGQGIDSGEPSVPTAVSLSDSKVGLGNLEPVVPVSGWMDSDVITGTPAPVAAAPSDPFDTPVADVIESSDIFSGSPVKTAEPVETSDVVSATTGYEPPVSHPIVKPAEPGRPSDVALTFNDPPGGSTMQDGDLSDLPVADEVADSGISLLGSFVADDESIHDQPGMVPNNSLLDSATLANAPDFSADPTDATDFGAAPASTSDASSILADLSGPDRSSDGDSSSVRVEAPGVDRTLTGEPSDDVFDLTVSDEPTPAVLFDEQDAGTSPEATSWQDQSGSDLISQGHTAVDLDLDDVIDVVEPVEVELLDDQPSLSSTPSSNFSETEQTPGSSSDAPSNSASVRIGHAQPTDDLADSVEFTDFPELEQTLPSDTLPSDVYRQQFPNLNSADFEAPAPATSEPDADGAVDWDAAALADDEHATRGMPQDASLSAILRGEFPDGSDEVFGEHTQALAPAQAEEADEPVVSVDWLAGSDEGSAVAEPAKTEPVAKRKGKQGTAEPKPRLETKTNPNRNDRTGTGSGTSTATTERSTKPTKKSGGMVVGLLVGAIAVGGAFAGVYFGGVIPNGEKGSAKAPSPGPDGKVMIDGQEYILAKDKMQPPAVVDPQTSFASGDTAKALEHFKNNPPATLTEKTTAGHIRVFAKVQSLKEGEIVPADDAELKAAREDLQTVIATVDVLGTEPGAVKRAVKASVALGVSHELTGDTKTARKVYTDAMEKYPTYKSTFEALIDKLDALEPPTAAPGTGRRLDPVDAERLLFAIALLLQDGPKGEDPEPGVYYWKAINLAAGGKYPEAILQITDAKKAHAARAKAVAGRGVNPLSDPLEQIFTRSCDELKAYWELRGAIYGNPALAAAIKKDGLAKAVNALLQAEKDVIAARDTVKKLEGDIAKLDKDAKDFEKGKIEAEKKFDTATAELKAAEKDAKEQKDTLAMVVDALKPVAPLPEKWAPADLIAATKTVASRATGPDLKNLVPNTMVAIGGGGLATGQLLEIADRITKAEAAAKIATVKLETETKRLTDKYDTDTKKLKDDSAAALKTLKDGNTEDIKKLTDKYAIDSKKLTDDYTTATAKLKEEHTVALKTEQANTDAEKKRAVLREIELQKQLANAVTAGQVMDLWLPTLTDLRRASDSTLALAAANKALAGSPPDSEDAAKAKTVRGMAYLLAGDLVNAKDSFQAARRSPTYKATAKKFWMKVADDGLEAVTDPVAPYRQPVVVPPVDLRAAAVSLDAGMSAYKAGRYDAAVKALQDATKNNPADPVAWYFLGATRWAQGDEEQAKKDFVQGSEREKVSLVPNRTLSASLTLIQGAPRDALDRTRP